MPQIFNRRNVAELRRVGREKLNFLFNDLGLLQMSSHIIDAQALGKKLALVIPKMPEAKAVRLALEDEAKALHSSNGQVVSPRGAIILAALEYGMTRRTFLRLSGLAMVGSQAKLPLPIRIFYSQDIPEFSESKLREYIAAEVARRGGNYPQTIAGGIEKGLFPPHVTEGFVDMLGRFQIRERGIEDAIYRDPAIVPGLSKQETERRISHHFDCYVNAYDQVFNKLISQAVLLEGPEAVRSGSSVDRSSGRLKARENYWPIPWLGFEQGFYGYRAVFYPRTELPFLEDEFVPI
ncbi:MAG: hypothetical protein ABIA67_02685 [Candidatus Margulisiibacteriota bacterium]